MEGSKMSPAGLIIRQWEPTNLEMPFDQVDSYLTPTELFYIRSHFLAPKLDMADYRLKIDGAVRTPLSVARNSRPFAPQQGIEFFHEALSSW